MFQHGWGTSLIGIQARGFVDVWAPLFSSSHSCRWSRRQSDEAAPRGADQFIDEIGADCLSAAFQARDFRDQNVVEATPEPLLRRNVVLDRSELLSTRVEVSAA